jgi:geranylgeranyl diphosphate synthase type I
VARLRSIISDTGALERTERRIATLTDAALTALAAAAIDEEARAVLTELAAAATRRLH